jgi:hypothetical protein
MHDEAPPLGFTPTTPVEVTGPRTAEPTGADLGYQDSRIKPSSRRIPSSRTPTGSVLELISPAMGDGPGRALAHLGRQSSTQGRVLGLSQRDVEGRPFPVQLCVNVGHQGLRSGLYRLALATTSTSSRYLSRLRPSALHREKLTEVQRLVRLPLGACFCDSCRAEAEARDSAGAPSPIESATSRWG